MNPYIAQKVTLDTMAECTRPGCGCFIRQGYQVQYRSSRVSTVLFVCERCYEESYRSMCFTNDSVAHTENSTERNPSNPSVERRGILRRKSLLPVGTLAALFTAIILSLPFSPSERQVIRTETRPPIVHTAAVTVPEQETASAQYAAPRVQTSLQQSGSYGIGNILMTHTYRTYQGPASEFSFRYPLSLYDAVGYSFQDDGRTIDIQFTSRNNSSKLLVSFETLTGTESMQAALDSEVRDLKAELSDPKMVVEVQTAAEQILRLSGEIRDGSTMIHSLIRLTDQSLEKMVLEIPNGSSSEDRAIREYYCEWMLASCGFSGKESIPSWERYRQRYGL